MDNVVTTYNIEGTFFFFYGIYYLQQLWPLGYYSYIYICLITMGVHYVEYLRELVKYIIIIFLFYCNFAKAMVSEKIEDIFWVFLAKYLLHHWWVPRICLELLNIGHCSVNVWCVWWSIVFHRVQIGQFSFITAVEEWRRQWWFRDGDVWSSSEWVIWKRMLASLGILVLNSWFLCQWVQIFDCKFLFSKTRHLYQIK